MLFLKHGLPLGPGGLSPCGICAKPDGACQGPWRERGLGTRDSVGNLAVLRGERYNLILFYTTIQSYFFFLTLLTNFANTPIVQYPAA